MGLFSKTKTRVDRHKVKIIQHKIVKLSYIQTLAVTGGLVGLKDIAPETDKSTKTSVNRLKRGGLSKLGKMLAKDLSFFPGGPLIGGLAGALFGKKVTVTTKEKVTSSGWKMVKAWLQPEFDKIRYAIGLRELTVAQFRYEKVSEVVSKPWTTPKEISSVSLIVDEVIPEQFPPGPPYIKYFVRPELKNQDWLQINPLGGRTVYDDNGQVVPRIIHFNSEKPVTARLEDAYISTPEPVKQIRFRAVLTRPDSIDGEDASGYTPILKSYRMLLTQRGGL